MSKKDGEQKGERDKTTSAASDSAGLKEALAKTAAGWFSRQKADPQSLLFP